MPRADSVLPLLRSQFNQERMLETAVRLMDIHSPTRDAGAALDELAQILVEGDFEVSREDADWPPAPAVVAWLRSSQPGPVLQFDCHLDTVHLPFKPPRIQDGKLLGTGASDMKGGTAAAVEALRLLKELDLPKCGSVLLTGHDHHEGPWGDKRQVEALCRAGIHGDAVLLPEYQAAWLPTAGRGMAIFRICVSREQPPSHEIHTAPDTPDVIQAGLELIDALRSLPFLRLRPNHPQVPNLCLLAKCSPARFTTNRLKSVWWKVHAAGLRWAQGQKRVGKLRTF